MSPYTHESPARNALCAGMVMSAIVVPLMVVGGVVVAQCRDEEALSPAPAPHGDAAGVPRRAFATIDTVGGVMMIAVGSIVALACVVATACLYGARRRATFGVIGATLPAAATFVGVGASLSGTLLAATLAVPLVVMGTLLVLPSVALWCCYRHMLDADGWESGEEISFAAAHSRLPAPRACVANSVLSRVVPGAAAAPAVRVVMKESNSGPVLFAAAPHNGVHQVARPGRVLGRPGTTGGSRLQPRADGASQSLRGRVDSLAVPGLVGLEIDTA